jgi:uncharacterized OsmC-like protein
MTLRKVRHDRNFKLAHEGQHWTVDLAEWRDSATGKGELRAYAVNGDITSPLLRDALELEADKRCLAHLLGK